MKKNAQKVVRRVFTWQNSEHKYRRLLWIRKKIFNEKEEKIVLKRELSSTTHPAPKIISFI